MGISGRSVLVARTARGFGFATAERFVAERACVLLSSIDAAQVCQLEIRDQGR